MTTSLGDTVVLLERALPRREPFVEVPPLDLAASAGLHAVVGTPTDGTLAIAKLVGGIDVPRRGKVVVAGRAPARDPRLRARIGVTLSTPLLPTSGNVAALLRHIDRLRQGNHAGEVLARLGLGHWQDRKLASLSKNERRALELVVAISTPQPIAIVVTEPSVDMAPIDHALLGRALADAAQSGAAVIVVTASMSDAVELGGTIHLLERGAVTRTVAAADAAALSPGRSAVLRVEVDLPRLLVASLADDPAVVGVDWDEQDRRATIAVRGVDLDRLAIAVARAAGASGASVRSIAPLAPGIEEARAATSGLALAAYHAAYRSYAPTPSVLHDPSGRAPPPDAASQVPFDPHGTPPPDGGAP